MNINDLDGGEKTALVGLLAYMIDADGRVARQEAIELLALQEEMGATNLAGGVGKAIEIFEDRDELLTYAAGRVKREAARELIRTVLHDLAQADGNRVRPEKDLLDDLTLKWVRAG